jgi:hypothetical protein
LAGLRQQLSLACQPPLQGVTRRQAIQISFEQALKLAAQYADEARNLFGRQRLFYLAPMSVTASVTFGWSPGISA